MTYSSFGHIPWLGWSDVEALQRINNKWAVVTAFGPVDLVVTDGEGNVVSKTVNQIPGAVYAEQDLNGDGDRDDRITIPDPATGGYSITVIPEPGADPNDTVTLIAEDHGATTILRDEVRIADLPTEPIVISVDRTAPVLSADPNPAVLGQAESWLPVHVNLQVQDETDPNPQVALVGIEPSWETDPSSVIRGADYGQDDRDFELFAARGADERYYTLTYATSDATGNVGYATATVYIAGRIGGRVYLDADNDGVDDGEPGIEGVPVALNGTDWRDHSVSLTTVTDQDGYYTFENLSPGTYDLTETQPGTYLDGDDAPGTLGGEAGDDVITSIVLGSGQIGEGYNFAEIEASVVQGLAWEDFNNDGEVDFGEKAVEGVVIELSGTDDRGGSVDLTATTDGDGVYAFFDLRPGNYAITETQPAGFEDGVDSLGTVNGVPTGNDSVNDMFSAVVLEQPGSIAVNYNFGERPPAGGQVTPGQTAAIGFWQNKHGQALISAVNDDDLDGQKQYKLGNWLACTFPNMYGTGDSPFDDQPGSNLSGLANDQVAEFYSKLFLRKKKEAVALGLAGPTKMDAQAMAVAFACYVTNERLAGTIAADYGFLVTEHGVGTSTFSVGDSGEAFGVVDNRELTVLDLLFATDERSWEGVLYDMNHDGDTDDAEDELETLYRTLANDVYAAINEQGDR